MPRRRSRAAEGSRSEIGLARAPATTDARRLAWQVLTAVEGGAFADAALGASGCAPPPSSRATAALATQLVYGTLAWQG